MTSSLVGSEMCIRDRRDRRATSRRARSRADRTCFRCCRPGHDVKNCPEDCLLYTSDAADDM
eukprot:7877070-Prorocentrum_lima.AAC.1